MRMALRSQTDNCFLLCGMRNWGAARQLSSRIRLLLSGSPGLTIGPNLVPVEDSLLRRQIEAAGLVSIPTRRVTGDASALQHRKHVFLEACRGLLGRRGMCRLWRMSRPNDLAAMAFASAKTWHLIITASSRRRIRDRCAMDGRCAPHSDGAIRA